MAHSLFVGTTESGKTTLAKSLCAQYRAQGFKALVLDAAHNGWNADFETGDPEKFFDMALRSRRCALFIDEAGTALGWLQKEAVQIATMFRHFGHFAHFIGQRHTMVAPSVRHNCTRLFIFSISTEDAADLKAEWRHPEIMHAPALQQGEFLFVKRFGTPTRHKIF